MRIDRLVLIVLALGLSSVLAQAGSVLIAERPLLGPFPTVQAAVDAALEGESLLVTPGAYAPFVIDGKSVHVFVTGSGAVTITGKVAVRNIAPAQSVLLSRLEVKGIAVWPNVLPALEIQNVAGHVRVQDSSFEGIGFGTVDYSSAGTAVRVIGSLNVVFSSCTIEGGYIGGFFNGDPYIDGGTGVDSVNSSIALYDCLVEGGRGSDESGPRGGHGGHAFSALSYGVFASGCTFKGGIGGAGDTFFCMPPGNGGDALRVDACQAHLLANVYAPGVPGSPFCSGIHGSPGEAIHSLNGSFIDLLSGSGRKISTATSISSDDTNVAITITGQPGDRVFLMQDRKPAWIWSSPLHGVWMIPFPSFSLARPTGTIGAGGTLVIQSKFPIADGTVAAQLNWLQAICVDSSGQKTLTGPAYVLALE